MTMTEAELAELQKACDSATPGPWFEPAPGDGRIYDIELSPDEADDSEHPRLASVCYHRDSKLIALARNALPTLLAMVRELKAAIQDITDSTSGCVLETCSIVPCDRCMAVAKAYSLLSAPAAKETTDG